MQRNRSAILMVFTLMILAAASFAQDKVKAATTQMLVTPEYLNAHLNDANLVILQVGEFSDFDKGHIPGAQKLPYDAVSTPMNHMDGSLMLELLSPDETARVFEKFGVSDDSHIVLVMSGDWISLTTRVYFTLDSIGLGKNTSFLDGGFPAWKAAGMPVTKDVKPIVPGHISKTVRGNLVAQASWINDHLGDSKLSVIDARRHEYYTAAKSDGNPRQGHIPGAGNLPIEDIVDKSNRIKSPDELKVLFAKAGYKDGNHLVVYCHIGQRATLLYFTAKLLGYDVQLYDGSWDEWSKHKEWPVVDGEAPGKK